MRKRAIRACAWWLLLAVDMLKTVGGFPAVHRLVSRWRWPALGGTAKSLSDHEICELFAQAVNSYWHKSQCLQEAAALVVLLRACGRSAELHIGVRSRPFLAHAWVKVGERYVSGSGFQREKFALVERL